MHTTNSDATQLLRPVNTDVYVCKYMHINTCMLQAHGTPNHASLSLSRHEQVPVNLSHMLGSAEGRAGNVKQRGAEQQRSGALEVAWDSEGARELCVHTYICVCICIYIHTEGDTYL